MQKKYVVRLTEPERSALAEVVKKLKGSSQKVRRAQVLLKADADRVPARYRPLIEAYLRSLGGTAR